MAIPEIALQESDITLFDAIFSPRAVALVGISGDLGKNSARPLRFMRRHGYPGRIHLVNASRAEIGGEPAYASLDRVPGVVDHAFVMVPGAHVVEVLEQCAAKGVKVMTVFSDGFAETGAGGRLRQEALLARARELGVRLIGPNSIGVADVHTGTIISVNAVFEMDELVRGGVSLVSQSGSMMGALLSRAATRGLGFAKLVSVGNEADIKVGELVTALADDEATRVIALFLETLRDGPELGRALDQANRAGKPVLVYKLGRSEQGGALSESHTGAIAGNDAAVDAFLRAHGALRVQMLETLFELAPLAMQHVMPVGREARAPRVGVITTTGGGAATVVDRLGLEGVVAVAPPAEFVARMAARGVAIRQTPVIDLTLAATSAQYKDLLEQMLASDWCDAVLSVVGSSAQFHPQLAVRPLVEASKPADKPLAVFLAPEAPRSLALLQQHGIAAFRSPESCADALAAFLHWRPPVSSPRPQGLAWPAGIPVRGNLTEFEACQVFASLGVPVATAQRITPDAPGHAVPYPVAIKLSSRLVAHKTELGGVQTGIRDQAHLRTAIASLKARVESHGAGVPVEELLVQQMEGKLLELMLGFRRDPLVGPVVVLGAGGIAAEIAHDYSVRLAPVDLEGAREMIEEVRATRLVRGFRGLPLADCEALARAIAGFSRLAEIGSPQVHEAEINPLFVQEQRVVAVDGLLRFA